MKVLVTGGAGFIGSNTVEYLLEKGYEVVAFDNLRRKGVEHNLKRLSDNPDFTFVRGDIRNLEDFDFLPKGLEGVIHLAANPGIPWSLQVPRYDFDVNALGTFNILEFARKNGNIPVVYASTNKVYSDKVNEIPLIEKEKRYEFKDKDFLGFNEKFPIDGCGDGSSHSPYGCSKYTGDIYCQEYAANFNVPTVVNRMSCIYGKWQHGVADQGWVMWFVRAALLDLPLTIYGDGKQVRDCLYGRDLAELYESELRNINVHGGKVYNAGGGVENTLSLLELIDYLEDKTGKKLKTTFTEWRPADHRVYISDISKVSKFWKPKTSIKKGLDSCFEWAKENLDILRDI